MQPFSYFLYFGKATPLYWLLQLQIGFRDDEYLHEELVNTCLSRVVAIAPHICK
jgi:hypothetical protein